MLPAPTGYAAVLVPVPSKRPEVVGGIGQWDGHGFTNEDDRLIWCDPAENPQGMTTAAVLDEEVKLVER